MYFSVINELSGKWPNTLSCSCLSYLTSVWDGEFYRVRDRLGLSLGLGLG